MCINKFCKWNEIEYLNRKINYLKHKEDLSKKGLCKVYEASHGRRN